MAKKYLGVQSLMVMPSKLWRFEWSEGKICQKSISSHFRSKEARSLPVTSGRPQKCDKSGWYHFGNGFHQKYSFPNSLNFMKNVTLKYEFCEKCDFESVNFANFAKNVTLKMRNL